MFDFIFDRLVELVVGTVLVFGVGFLMDWAVGAVLKNRDLPYWFRRGFDESLFFMLIGFCLMMLGHTAVGWFAQP